MQAFPEFRHMPTPFWAMVKYVSETLGYTIRGQGIVRTYSIDEIDRLLSQNGIVVGYETIESAKQYFDMRANLLNHQVQRNLMNSEAAKETFERLYPLHRDNDFKCILPMNKQKGAMKQVAFFTAILRTHCAALPFMTDLLVSTTILVAWCMCLMIINTSLALRPDVLMGPILISLILGLYEKSKSIIMQPLLEAEFLMVFMKHSWTDLNSEISRSVLGNP